MRHNAAMVALEVAQQRNATLLGVQQCIQQEIMRKQAELDRVGIAITHAHREQQEAETALAAAALQLAPAATGPAVAHVAPAVTAKATLLETLLCAVNVTLGACKAEAVKKN